MKLSSSFFSTVKLLCLVTTIYGSLFAGIVLSGYAFFSKDFSLGFVSEIFVVVSIIGVVISGKVVKEDA